MSIYRVIAISRMSDSQALADQLQVILQKVRVHLASARFAASWEIKFSRLQLLFANQTLFFVREPIFWGQRAVLELFPGLLFFRTESVLPPSLSPSLSSSLLPSMTKITALHIGYELISLFCKKTVLIEDILRDLVNKSGLLCCLFLRSLQAKW